MVYSMPCMQIPIQNKRITKKESVKMNKIRINKRIRMRISRIAKARGRTKSRKTFRKLIRKARRQRTW